MSVDMAKYNALPANIRAPPFMQLDENNKPLTITGYETLRALGVIPPKPTKSAASANASSSAKASGGRRKSKKSKKPTWRINQNKLKKKSLRTQCGKLGGKYPTKKTCPKGCDFIDMGSGGTYCYPKKNVKQSRKSKRTRKSERTRKSKRMRR